MTSAPMKIAAGEWLATHWEFEELIGRGKIDVAQPDIGRVGGFLEAQKVCRPRGNTRAHHRAALLENRAIGDRDGSSCLQYIPLRLH